ncbi:MAG: hypothetical protein R2864_05530 [Syntrophotaleaceae bacterium]
MEDKPAIIRPIGKLRSPVMVIFYPLLHWEYMPSSTIMAYSKRRKTLRAGLEWWDVPGFYFSHPDLRLGDC